MKILKAFKVELNPNNKQRTLFMKAAGTDRFVYNWGLAKNIELYEKEKKSLSAFDLSKELNKVKDIEYPWMRDVSKCVPQASLGNLWQAFKNFFVKCKNKKAGKFNGKVGFPKFKSRYKAVGGFRLYGAVRVSDSSICLPRIGKVRLKETGYIPAGVTPTSTTVSEYAGRWFVSVQVEIDNFPLDQTGKPAVGIDLGIKSLATCSDGKKFENPKALKRYTKKLRRCQRKVSRRKKGSANRKKAVKQLQKIHYRIGNIRKDAVYKLTDYLTKTKSVICIEDLNVSGMMKNHCLAQSIADANWGEIKRQLEYKTRWRGNALKKIDRFYPSSKECSTCHEINHELTLKERTWTCKCGVVHDRDLNAALNIEAAGLADSLNACGPEKAQASGLKQE